MRKVIILYGSKTDVDFAGPMRLLLEEFGINFEQRVASAHKTPEKVLRMLKEYEASGDEIVYITVAGKSNALSGFVDANVRYPVIACPPNLEKFPADIYSSLRMPSGVAPLVILDPEAAALAAAKMLALGDEGLSKRVTEYQRKMKEKIEVGDQSLRGGLKRKR